MPSNTFAAQATIDPQAEPVAQVSATPESVPPADPQVALIVGDRAFATMDDVKTKITNADAHIGNIETENASMRAELDAVKAELATATSLEQVLASKETNQGTTLTREEIQSLVSDSVGTIDSTKLSNANREGCIAAAETAYGQDYIVKMDAMAKDLGLTMVEVDEMAGSNPKLFSKTFLPTATPVAMPTSSHASTIRTPNLQTTPVESGYKPVLSLTSKERTAQLIKQLEELPKQN